MKLKDSWHRNDVVLPSPHYFAVIVHQSHFCAHGHKKNHNYKSVTVSSICHDETFKNYSISCRWILL